MLIIQEAGQLGGLIGRTVMVGEHLDGFACSNNMIRLIPEDDVDAGYLFVVLNSEFGVRLLSREAAGSSIPHTDEQRVKRLHFRGQTRRSASRSANLRFVPESSEIVPANWIRKR